MKVIILRRTNYIPGNMSLEGAIAPPTSSEAGPLRVIGGSGKSRYVYWALTALFLVLCVLYVIVRQPIFLIFSPVGIGFAIAAIRASIRYSRFGKSVLVLHDHPQLGATLRGEIQTSRAALQSGDAPFIVRLSGNQIEIPRGKVQLTPEGIAIPIEFALPEDALASSTIDVSRAMPGINFSTSFPFKVPKSVDLINQRFGARIGVSFFDEIADQAEGVDEIFEEAVTADDFNSFALSVKKKIDGLVLDRKHRNETIVSKYFNDPEFQKVVFDKLALMIYQYARRISDEARASSKIGLDEKEN